MEATEAVHLRDCCRDHRPREYITLFASLELSKSKWVVKINRPGRQRLGRRRGQRARPPGHDCSALVLEAKVGKNPRVIEESRQSIFE